MQAFDVIIAGAGCAGMTAALYALRAGCSVLLLEKEGIGGQIVFSPRVENFPTLKSISGSEFADRLFSQISELGAEFAFETVLSVRDGAEKTVTTDENTYECTAFIIATGVKPRSLDLENADKFTGRGISYCALCDGAFYKGRDVAVIGGGNTALQDALYLCEICKTVYLVHRRNEFRADKILVDKLATKSNLVILKNSVVSALYGDKTLDSIEITTNGNAKVLPISGVFCAIGTVPSNKPFENLVSLDENGFIEAFEDCKTKTHGVFAAGDCRKKSIRQLTTAACDGACAGTAAALLKTN